MSRRDWWLGVGIIAVALMVHAALPRFEWRDERGSVAVRIDRWTGRADRGTYADGTWQSIADRLAGQRLADEQRRAATAQRLRDLDAAIEAGAPRRTADIELPRGRFSPSDIDDTTTTPAIGDDVTALMHLSK